MGRQTDALVARMRDALAEKLSQTMLLARKSVTAATPIDTGHARSNWVLSVGAPYQSIDGSRQQVSTAVQEAGDARVAKYTGKDIKAGRRIYLKNNVPYMMYLDKGSSPQAKAGFIAKALLSRDAARYMPAGTKRHTRDALRSMARTAIRRGRNR